MNATFLLLFIFVLCCSAQTHIHSDDERINCEPGFLVTKKKARMKHYPFVKTPAGFWTSDIHSSKHMLSGVEAGDLDLEIAKDSVHLYTHLITLKELGSWESLRRTGNIGVWSLYYGHSATFHLFHRSTKTYEKRELGFHKQEYFAVTTADTWYAIEIEDREDVDYSFFGVSLINVGEKSPLVFAEEESLIEEFPLLEDTIRRLSPVIMPKKDK